MVLKIFRAVWFLSALGVLANLLFVYAGLREEVVLDEAQSISVSREVLFYVMVAVITLTNVLVYVIRRIYPADEDLRAWFHGLIITINIFFVVALSTVGLLNSGEKFDLGRLGFFTYGSVALIVLWATSWPFVRLYKRFYPQVKH